MDANGAVPEDRPLSAPPPGDDACHGGPPDQRRQIQPRSLSEALREAGAHLDGAAAGSETPSEEDYDENVRPAYATGGNYQIHGVRRRKQSPWAVNEQVQAHTPDGSKASIVRSSSNIHIFPDNDKAVQELLRKSSASAKEGQAEGKKRRKFRDHLFTHQFSAFDPHNTEAANSPFHGFYTLFWLAVTLFMFRIAAINWRTHGTVLGTNEIMKSMFRRDGKAPTYESSVGRSMANLDYSDCLADF